MTKPTNAKNFMNLSKKESLEVSQKLLENAVDFHKEAQILAQHKSFGRATSFLIFSMEENMKALILFLDGSGFEFRKRVKGIGSLFKNHKLRYPLAMLLSVINIFREDIQNMVNQIRSGTSIINVKEDPEKFKRILKIYQLRYSKRILIEIDWFSKAEYVRQDGIYVDYEDMLKQPSDINKKNYKDVLLRVSRLREVSELLFITLNDSDEKIKEEVVKNFKDLHKSFIANDFYKVLAKGVTFFTSKDKETVPFNRVLDNLREYIEYMIESDED